MATSPRSAVAAAVVVPLADRVPRRVQRLALVAPDRRQPGHERRVVLEAGRCPPNEGFAIRSQSYQCGFFKAFHVGNAHLAIRVTLWFSAWVDGWGEGAEWG